MEAVKEQGTLSVHIEKLFPIIKKWLYAERDIFLRELISNAYDAIYKLERLGDMGEYKEIVPVGRVDIAIDKQKKTLTIADNGLGMTGEEVKKYINQIAFSGAEEFLAKYEQGGDERGIIGHFGLGFFSAFMVSSETELITRSYKFPQDKDSAVHWRCKGSTDFSLSSATRETVGTDVILHISEDNRELLDEERIKQLVVRYSDFLPMEIMLNGKQINKKNPLWQRVPKEVTDGEYKDFYGYLFPQNEPALFHVHLNMDFPFRVKGILYFPKIRADLDITKAGRIKLFCNNVFVSDNIVDIIPQYLNMLQGVIDSAELPLNVSRSALQQDARVKKLAGHIVRKLAEKLVALHKEDSKQYETYWKDIHPFVKFGVIHDSNFYDKVKPALLFRTLGKQQAKESSAVWAADAPKDAIDAAKTAEKAGEATQTAAKPAKQQEASAQVSANAGTAADEIKLTTLQDYQQRNPKLKDKVLYATDAENEHRYIVDVEARGGEVLLLNSPIDPHYIQYLETKLAPLRFLRVDSATVDELMAAGDDVKDKALDEEGEKLYIGFFKHFVELPQQDVVLRSLQDKRTAAVLVVNEHLRRFREMSSMMQTELPQETDKLLGMTLVLNRLHPVIIKTRSWLRGQGAVKEPSALKPPLAMTSILRSLYDLSLLQAGKLRGEALSTFTERVGNLLEKEANLE